jgi:hypothetical protein
MYIYDGYAYTHNQVAGGSGTKEGGGGEVMSISPSAEFVAVSQVPKEI